MLVIESIHLGCDPGRDMDSVGYRSDRDLILGRVRPERLPHLAANLTVQLADGIAHACESQCKRRHVEARSAIGVGIAAERQKTLAIDAELLPIACEMLFNKLKRKSVMAGGNGCMSREDRCCADLRRGFVEGHARFDQLAY